jgi:peptide chain release factor 3
VTWPVGIAGDFRGVIDRRDGLFTRFTRVARGATEAPEEVVDPAQAAIDEGDAWQAALDGITLLDEVGADLDVELFLGAQSTPTFFGSALTNFGVRKLLDAIIDLVPSPSARVDADGAVRALDDPFSGFVFKVQANMDPSHRDRIAFLRICSGKFTGGMRVQHYRLNKEIRLARAEQLMAQERQVVDEAWAGDIIGLYDPGQFRIGDTLSTEAGLSFDSVPRFSPEHFSRVSLRDPMKRKQLQKGIEQLAEEGTIQLFLEPGREKDPILGVVGELQFDVLKFRLENEYGAKVELERLGYSHARWVEGPSSPQEIMKARIALGVADQDGRPVALLRDDWELRRAQQDNPTWKFSQTAPIRA